MIVNKEDNQTIHEISLLSGVDKSDIEKVFEAFLTQFVINYSNSKRIHIPFIGNFLVKYREDNEKTGNYTELDVFTNLKKIIKKDFKTVVEA